MQINFDTAQLDRVARLMAQVPEIAQEEIAQFVASTVAQMQHDVVQRTPTAHGRLRESIIGSVKRLGGLGVEGIVGTSSAYAVPVELGTDPHWVPVAPLIDWARQRLGLRGKEAVRAGHAIKWKIAREGTKPKYMFQKTFEASEAQIKTGLDRALDSIQARMTGLP